MDDKGRHKVFREYAEEVAHKITCDLCYIDPPYMKRQYAANYHLLETLAREDEPEAIGVSGLRPWRGSVLEFLHKDEDSRLVRAHLLGNELPSIPCKLQ